MKIDQEIEATLRVVEAFDELERLPPDALARSLDWIARFARERAVEVRQAHPELPPREETP